MTPDEIVTAYVDSRRIAVRAEMRFFETQPSSVEAITNAVRPGGRKHDHQYRIPPVLLNEAERRLQGDAERLKRALDFAELHRALQEKIGVIPGIGPLTVYDVAHRLAAFLGKAPALVYLHAGTKAGAAVLGFRGKAIHPDVLPAAFSRLSPAEIEDCFCIYKDDLGVGAIRTGYLQRSSHCRKPAFRRMRKC